MGASILCAPTQKGKSVSVNAPSSFINAMEKVFGTMPFCLNMGDTDKLEAMQAANPNEEDAYTELINEIYDRGEIRVWKEY